MKIAYVTTYDSTNEHAWSGSGYYMCKAMEEAGCRMERFGNLKVKMDLLFKVKKAYYKFLLAKNYQKQREPVILKSYSKQLSKSLTNHDFDALLSPGTIPIAYLNVEKPVVFWTDATFAGMVDFFPDFSNLPKESIEHGNEMEQAALDRCALAIYTSTWAADSAIRHYKVNPNKVKVVPYGANIETNPNHTAIDRIASTKSFDACRLLFIGVDWHRKGGDMAVKVAALLNARGIKTELHLLGSAPRNEIPSYAIVHGFLSKKLAHENKKIESLYEHSHFLLLPTIADCVPVVIAEASSFGLPTISTRVGGINSAISNGVNGQTFELTAKAAEYAEYIAELFLSPQKYKSMMHNTFREFNEKLNWRTSGKRVKELIETL